MTARKVLFIFLLSTVLLFLSAAGEPVLRPLDEKAASRKALELFRQCAFHSEYGPVKEQSLTRWEDEIRIWAGGSPTREDLQTLDAFLADLSGSVSGLPAIRRVRQDQDANIRVWFIPGYMLKHYIEGYVEGNWGFFHYEHPQGKIVSARIGIASDLTEQAERNHLILEELVGALGLPGDHVLYADSILYDGPSETQTLSDADWRMLNMLYSPDVSAGMSWPEAQQALHRALGL